MAIFDNEALYSQSNAKMFAGTGLYINWTDNKLSLGENLTFDDGDAKLKNIIAQALKLSNGAVVTEHTGQGSVTTVSGIVRERIAFSTFEMAGSGSSGTIISVPVGAFKALGYKVEMTAGKDGANTIRVLEGTARTDTNGNLAGTSNVSTFTVDQQSGWSSNRPSISASPTSGNFNVSHGNPDSADVEGTTKLTLWISDLPPGAGTPSTPSAPSITNICASGTGLKITWSEPLGIDSYQLERSPDGSSSWAILANTTDNNFTDSLPFFDPDETYHYRVKGIYDGGETAYSTTDSDSYNGATSC